MPDTLHSVYDRFTSFGSSASLATSHNNISGNEALMDNAKFAKMCKDTKVIGKGLTLTDVDIIFTKVKDKAARKIDYTTFEKALHLLAEKKYAKEDPSVAFKHLESDILRNGSPELNGTTKAESGGVLDRLTDTALYTGAHKARFNEDGTGRGKEGRTTEDEQKTLSGMVSRA